MDQKELLRLNQVLAKDFFTDEEKKKFGVRYRRILRALQEHHEYVQSKASIRTNKISPVTIGDLLSYKSNELLTQPNIGKRTLHLLEEVLAERGLVLPS